MILSTLKVVSATAALLLLSASNIADAQSLVTFETTPSGGTPIDDTPLDAPYSINGGGTVRFFFDTNGNNVFDPGIDALPIFEAKGGDGTDGFTSSQVGQNAYDQARPGFESQLGNFFLRAPAGNTGNVPGSFVIDYDTTQTIREFSGEIWDIDSRSLGTEQWRVDVLNGSGSVLATLVSPLGINSDVNSLDSLPWDFAFTNLPIGVDKVRLTFIGNKTSGIGLAFNNFSPTFAITSVPEPSSLALLAGMGLSGAGFLARRHRALALRSTDSRKQARQAA